jgi:hypothetical protein
VAYAKEPFGGPQQVLKYLTGYTHRGAFNNRRLVKVDDHRVTFIWKDYADNCARKEMTLDALELVRRFALHIVSKGFVRIRRYGLLANRDHAVRLAMCRYLIAASAEPGRPANTVTEPSPIEEMTTEAPVPSWSSSEEPSAASCAIPAQPPVQCQPVPPSATRIGIVCLALLISLHVRSGDIHALVPTEPPARPTMTNLADHCPSCGAGRLDTVWQWRRPGRKERQSIPIADSS